MLPNHAPLRVAEDLQGIGGAAPGAHRSGARAGAGHRRHDRAGPAPLARGAGRERLPRPVGGACWPSCSAGSPEGPPLPPRAGDPRGRAPPPPVYLLGSSDFSARLAGEKGLGFAFAHHINPGPAVESLRLYRDTFRSSSGATSDARRHWWRCRRSARKRTSGRTSWRGRWNWDPAAVPGQAGAAARRRGSRRVSVHGRGAGAGAEDPPGTPPVRRLARHVAGAADPVRPECGVGEVMLSTMVHDHRLRDTRTSCSPKRSRCRRHQGETAGRPEPSTGPPSP
jgi:alkanesulfonate monooxygenase SsuD/methylene tetrahydromethanopterin reductase-like flavin-dependent oxidoreductase (luciferase family)